MSSETVKRRRKKGRGPRTPSTNNNDDDKKDATIAKLQSIIEQQQRLLDLFRSRAIRQIAVDDNGFGNLNKKDKQRTRHITFCGVMVTIQVQCIEHGKNWGTGANGKTRET